MDTSRDYSVGELLHEGRHGSIYSGVRRSDGHSVVLKSHGGNDASAERELAALRKAAGDGVVAALDLVRDGSRTLLALERVRGAPLDRWVAPGAPASVEVFLEIGIQLAAGLIRGPISCTRLSCSRPSGCACAARPRPRSRSTPRERAQRSITHTGIRRRSPTSAGPGCWASFTARPKRGRACGRPG